MNRQKQLRTGKAILCIAAVMSVAACVFSLSARIGYAADATRILVVPFAINAAEDLNYLQRGITDMLTSRLEGNSDIAVVSPDLKTDPEITTLAQRTNADYVVTGSITILGDSVSTDAQVAKGSAVAEPVLSFHQTGSRHADVIEHINALAVMINTRLLDRSEAAQPDHPDAVPPVLTVPAPTVDQKATPPTASPSAPMPSGSTSRQPAKATPEPGPSEPMQLPGFGNIKGQLNGITAGDVDGNGIDDIVTITADELTVYQFKQDRWVKLAQYESRGDFIGVDTADVNRNSRQEIFVTRFSQIDSRVLSFVMEWDGSALKRIATQLPWYFRSVDLYERGRTLVGQRQNQDKHFASDIYEMKWTDGAYAAGERLALPRGLSVFGFAYGPVRSPDKPEVVTYNSDDYIQILSPTGEEVWATTEKYGGGSTFVVFTDEEQWDVQDYIYLPPRIHLYDMDGDGVQEILAVKNQYSFTGSSVLERQRFYSKGRLEWLKCQNVGIRSIVQTLDMARFIADSALVDIDGDGEIEVVAAVVKKKRGIASKGSSYLTGFNIFPPE